MFAVASPEDFSPARSGDPSSPSVLRMSRLAGSLVEISGSGDSGVLSSAFELVAEAQHNQLRRQQPSLIAWIATTQSLFFPPDALETGVALERLVLLRLGTQAAQLRAATRIVHSGAFGLVVVDLVDSLPLDSTSVRPAGNQRLRRARPPGLPPLSQLAGLAQKYRTAVVLLTEKPPAAPSLDPRVGKRFDASRHRHGPENSTVVITVLKDKAGGGFSAPGALPTLSGRRFPGRGSSQENSTRKSSTPKNFTGTSSGAAPRSLPPGFRFERECREPAGMC